MRGHFCIGILCAVGVDITHPYENQKGSFCIRKAGTGLREGDAVKVLAIYSIAAVILIIGRERSFNVNLLYSAFPVGHGISEKQTCV